jgi:hypothetical protein
MMASVILSAGDRRKESPSMVKITVGAVVALVALIAGLSMAEVGPFGGGGECAKPVSERTGAWVCYEPDSR